ncbi:MAG: hypothetical protein F6J96_21320 [Symploca sp. SIO1C2]|nr:hypothetical protein [Symploca sp. SIO1C2]
MNMIRKNKLYLVIISTIIGVAITLGAMPLAAQAQPQISGFKTVIVDDSLELPLDTTENLAEKYYRDGIRSACRGNKTTAKSNFEEAAKLFSANDDQSGCQKAKNAVSCLDKPGCQFLC